MEEVFNLICIFIQNVKYMQSNYLGAKKMYLDGAFLLSRHVRRFVECELCLGGAISPSHISPVPHAWMM